MTVFIIASIAAAIALGALRATGWMWTVAIAAFLAILTLHSGYAIAWIVVDVVVAAIAFVLNVAPLRRAVVSNPLLGWYRRILPAMSQTERDAIDAGTVWWDGELFSGAPDWDKLLAYPEPKLTPEEQAFLDGPCEKLCQMLDRTCGSSSRTRASSA